MIGKFLFCLSAIAGTLLGLSAGAVTTSKNVDIIVTHGGYLPPNASADFFQPTIAVAPPGNKAPYTFGQAFRETDLPAGTYASPTDSAGNPLVYQIDDISPPWPDGSIKHVVYSVQVPATAGNTNARVKLVKNTGTYAPGATSRSIADLTTGHQYQAHYKNVKTHPGAAVSGAYGWANKGGGSNNYTCDFNTFIAAKQYRVYAIGPVKIGAYVYGPMTQDGGAVDPHLYCEGYFEAFSDAATPASVAYTKAYVRLSQPLINPTGGQSTNPDFVIGQASLTDEFGGTHILKDYATSSITLGPSDIDTVPGGGFSTGRFIPPASPVIGWGQAYEAHLIPGGSPANTFPAGLSEGLPVWTQGSAPNSAIGFPGCPEIALSLDAIGGRYGCDGGSGIYASLSTTGTQNGASTGHASFQLIPFQHMTYYGGFWIADKTGGPVMIPGTWSAPIRFHPNLDGTTNATDATSQKAYWQAAGLVPPWELPHQAQWNSCSTMSLDPYYYPGSNGNHRNSIDSGSASLDTDGAWNECEARWFIRMGASNFSLARDEMPSYAAVALTGDHLPQIQFLRASVGTGATGDGNVGPNPPRLIPWNNGPDKAGASYLGLGAPSLNDSFRAGCGGGTCPNTQTGWVYPDGVPNNYSPQWAYGTWNAGFSTYHWPPSAGILEYLIYGEHIFLDTVRRSANRIEFTIYDGRTYPVSGTNYYAMPATSVWAGAEVFAQFGFAAAFGNGGTLQLPVDPELAYFKDIMTDYWGYGAATVAGLSSAVKAAGWFNGQYIYEGFNAAYGPLGIAYARNVMRAPNSSAYLNLYTTFQTGFYDAPGDPTINTGTSALGSWGMSLSESFKRYSTYLGGWTNISSSYAPDPRRAYGVVDAGDTMLDTHGILAATINMGALVSEHSEAIITSGYSTGSYDGPPEFGPAAGFSELTPFYMCNVQKVSISNPNTGVTATTTSGSHTVTLSANVLALGWTPNMYLWTANGSGGIITIAGDGLSLTMSANATASGAAAAYIYSIFDSSPGITATTTSGSTTFTFNFDITPYAPVGRYLMTKNGSGYVVSVGSGGLSAVLSAAATATGAANVVTFGTDFSYPAVTTWLTPDPTDTAPSCAHAIKTTGPWSHGTYSFNFRSKLPYNGDLCSGCVDPMLYQASLIESVRSGAVADTTYLQPGGGVAQALAIIKARTNLNYTGSFQFTRLMQTGDIPIYPPIPQ